MIDLAGAEHDSQQKMKYQEDLQKMLLILNRPQFIISFTNCFGLIKKYQKKSKKVILPKLANI